MPGLSFDGNPAQFRESVDSGLAAETAIPRGLDPAERHLCLVLHRRSIDVAHPGLDLPRNPQAARRVASEDGRRKSILGIVRQFDGLCLVPRAYDGNHGAKALLAK